MALAVPISVLQRHFKECSSPGPHFLYTRKFIILHLIFKTTIMNNIKRLFVLSLCTFIFFSSFAQSNKEDVDMIQAMYGKQKKEIAAEFIIVPDAKKDAFWKIYDNYETE